ncbi:MULTISPECIES: thiamine ABC transporter substrate binding subunit [unclassified Vibrio]|uniref:Thiamine-binding periplasmic protein n=1 Tax=Vibrio sp. HB236076 TaxID=3232307 RepID=A0AB39HK85_9VIBR|nr:thiamine ABC transporter substrate binding subunit [Vibrio sp. HB161653]MDP5255584.1 thiamine ABC transporter substrate binding subunit [Vibrio sp. HB161653]
MVAISALVSSHAWAEKPVLQVYTYDSFASDWGPGPKVKTGFEQQCGCEVQFVSLDDGVSILNRLRLEGKNSQADIALGLDNNLINEAQKTGLFADYQLDSAKLTLPNGWQNTTFLPYDYGYFSFVYNKEKLSNPPSSFAQLVERQDLRIIYQDPRTSTPGQGLMLWVKALYGDKASSVWKALAKQTVTVTKGWSEAYSLFLKGESDMVLSYTTSPAYHLIAEGDDQYAATSFSEGEYVQVEVAAALKNAPHPELAQAFLNYLVSDDVQSIIPTTNWMYPVTDVALPEGYRGLAKPTKVLSLPAEEVATHRRDWIREWQQALTH